MLFRSVDTVRAPDHRGRPVLVRPPGDRRFECGGRRDDPVEGPSHLQGQGGIDHVARGQAVVDPGAGGHAPAEDWRGADRAHGRCRSARARRPARPSR